MTGPVEVKHYCPPMTINGVEYTGCLGMSLSCGHGFECMSDPALATHRCAAMWTPMLWSIFLAVAAFAAVYAIAHR